MELFIGNLPENYTHHDLVRLFNGFGGMVKDRIIARQEWGVDRRYGCVDFKGEAEAMKAMDSVNGQLANGNNLVVREYHHRSSFNERRALDWRQQPWHRNERRQGERRGLGAWFKTPPSNLDNRSDYKVEYIDTP